MQNNLKISIVIPTYNYGSLITRALDSIYNQDLHQNIICEIIVVDDCSTDNTHEILADYLQNKKTNAHISCTMMSNSINQGAAISRNKGIKVCTGDYLIFLDADDMLTHNSINTICDFIKQINVFNINPEIILTKHNNFTMASNTTSNQIGKDYKLLKVSDCYKQRFIDYLFKKIIPVTAGSMVFHKEFFYKIQFCEELKLNEDIPVFAYAMVSPHFYFLNAVTVNVYKHSSSLRNQYKLLDEKANTTTLVDTVFNHQLLPAELMRLKKHYLSQRYLSLFRSYYLAKQYKLAKRYYQQAIKYKSINLFKINYFSKYLRTYLKSLISD